MRKTPAIGLQVVAPFLRSNALCQARLIDFDTGSSILTDQHMGWLRQTMRTMKAKSVYRIRLIGYASKLDDPDKNWHLSFARIDNTLKFMQTVDHNAMDRTETFRPLGEAAYMAGSDDNSPDYRAVEVHVFVGMVPPPPAQIVPSPRPLPAMPGGPRYTDWQVASPGGIFVGAGPGGGFNIFVVKNVKTKEERAYISPCGGAGASLNLPGLKFLGTVIRNILTGAQYGDMNYTSVSTKLPVTWAELQDCLVRVSGIGAGMGRGKAAAIVTFTASAVYQRSSSGNPLKLPGGDLFQFKTSGKDWQLGIGASVAAGPLIRVDQW